MKRITRMPPILGNREERERKKTCKFTGERLYKTTIGKPERGTRNCTTKQGMMQELLTGKTRLV
jgi:hypothetical protein